MTSCAYYNLWNQKWEEDNTPWASEPSDQWLKNEYESFRELGLKPNSNVLVPLCGNSGAVRFLWEKGHEVVAIEYVEKAVQSLITTRFQDLSFEENRKGIFSSDRITIHHCDFFDFQAPSPFHFIYDRAALIALFPEQRKRYIEKVCGLTAQGGFQCLISLETDGSFPDCPPFPMSEKEILESYPSFKILMKSQAQIEELSENMRNQGVSEACFTRYLMQNI